MPPSAGMGLVRVDDLEDLFDAVEMLSHAKRTRGERLAIVTKGGGARAVTIVQKTPDKSKPQC